MASDYSGPYAMGDPYARVTAEANEDEYKKRLICPKCDRALKSTSAYTLHVKKCCPDHLDREPYQRRQSHHPKGVWQLDICEFHQSLKVIDPKAYFITSGEAVRKTERLCEDLRDALHAASHLLVVLKTLKKDAKYLETQWESNRLLLKQKNPRPSSRISQRTKQNEQRTKKRAKKQAKKRPKKQNKSK
jgi:hypothetical protein